MPDSESLWFYLDAAGAQQGPVTRKSLHSLLASADVRRDTLVWTSGMPDWEPLSSAFADMMPPPVPAQAQPAGPAARHVATPPVRANEAQSKRTPAGTRFLLFGLLAAMCTLISFFGKTGGAKAWLMLTEFPYLLWMGLAEALGYSFISIGVGAILLTKDKAGPAFAWSGLIALLFAFLPQQ